MKLYLGRSRFLYLLTGLVWVSLSACDLAINKKNLPTLPKVNPPGGSTVLPLGAAVPGVTFSGSLAGKTMYRLPSPVNSNNCWTDSVFWNGSELFYGVSAINWTNLDQGSLVYNLGSGNSALDCMPPAGFAPQAAPGHTGNFNIYRSQVSAGGWTQTLLPINTGEITSLSAPKFSGNTMVFTKYEKASSYANIYLVQRTGDNTYATPTAFPLNSVNCNDDNPTIHSNATQIVFESNRNDASASSCGANQKLWLTSFSGGSWSSPVPLTGAPANATKSVTQPWLDSSLTTLYWTGTGADCSGGVTTCIMKASGSGTNWSNTAAQIITPTPVGLSWAGGGMLGLVGQYTEAGGYGFLACGIVLDIDPTGSTSGLIFGRFQINIEICAIPL